jgi:hypothetical protein
LLTILIFPFKKNVQAFTGQVFAAWPVLFFLPLSLFYLSLFFPGATGGATLQVVAPWVTASSLAKGDIFKEPGTKIFIFKSNYK